MLRHNFFLALRRYVCVYGTYMLAGDWKQQLELEKMQSIKDYLESGEWYQFIIVRSGLKRKRLSNTQQALSIDARVLVKFPVKLSR